MNSAVKVPMLPPRFEGPSVFVFPGKFPAFDPYHLIFFILMYILVHGINPGYEQS